MASAEDIIDGTTDETAPMFDTGHREKEVAAAVPIESTEEADVAEHQREDEEGERQRHHVHEAEVGRHRVLRCREKRGQPRRLHEKFRRRTRHVRRERRAKGVDGVGRRLDAQQRRRRRAQVPRVERRRLEQRVVALVEALEGEEAVGALGPRRVAAVRRRKVADEGLHAAREILGRRLERRRSVARLGEDRRARPQREQQQVRVLLAAALRRERRVVVRVGERRERVGRRRDVEAQVAQEFDAAGEEEWDARRAEKDDDDARNARGGRQAGGK